MKQLGLNYHCQKKKSLCCTTCEPAQISDKKQFDTHTAAIQSDFVKRGIQLKTSGLEFERSWEYTFNCGSRKRKRF